MENGEWEWKVENGKWRMENGKWKMENGKCFLFYFIGIFYWTPFRTGVKPIKKYRALIYIS
ncbi:MAG: hypothetical protein IPL63_02445 [Saprospiraceae bacterium]|nr:hypothetical protein [Saprospiraceae bacterium]